MPTLTGILNLNKPEGMTSRQAVTYVSKVLRNAGYGRKIKVGHCGTLDPLATGVLLICIGKATRLVPLIQLQTKAYTGTFRLGQVTSTDDVTGEILREAEVSPDQVTAEALNTLLSEFTGNIEQIPPAYSAVHVDGKRAYKLARQAKQVELPSRMVQVHRLELTAFDLPHFELLVECGSGTYIRSLGRDIGERLGCGATMKQLVRTRIGPFSVDEALRPDELDADKVAEQVLPPIAALGHLPAAPLDELQKQRVLNGREIQIDSLSDDRPGSRPQQIALVTEAGQLIAVASYEPDSFTAKPHMVFHDQA